MEIFNFNHINHIFHHFQTYNFQPYTIRSLFYTLFFKVVQYFCNFTDLFNIPDYNNIDEDQMNTQ